MLVVDWPWVELLRRKVTIASSRLVSPRLALPHEHECKQQHYQSNGANRVEHIRRSHRINPRRHGKYKDCAQRVSGEGQRYQRITNDLSNKR